MHKNIFSKYVKSVSNLHKDRRGMTGLETAIILIAFVTVAAVFGYAVLSAGLFSAERGKETIYAGLEEAKSNLEIAGSVIAQGDNATHTVDTVLFTVKNAIAGNPIDLTANSGATAGENKCVINLRTDAVYYNNIKWSYTAIGDSDGDNLLEVGEQFEIGIDLADLGEDFDNPNLGPNDQFSLQVKPSLGSAITIMRTLPPQVDDVMDLH